MIRFRALILLLFVAVSCQPHRSLLVDKDATARVVDVYGDITQAAYSGTLVGQHEPFAYGVGWHADGQSITSDFEQVAECRPAIVGWDFSCIDIGRDSVITGIQLDTLRLLVQKADELGCVTTFSWHAFNPIDSTDSWHLDEGAVASLLPTGKNYKLLRSSLESVAKYIRTLNDKQGRPIPILFRPWHEHTGDWFWWGTKCCHPEEFRELWRTTVKLLRDTMDIHSLLYVYSSAAVGSEAEYLERYPGDDYVDILGFDEYDVNENYVENMRRSIAIVRTLGSARRKPYAITETGYEGVKDAKWFTSKLYPLMRGQGLAYTLLWRNATPTHFYVPYKGHSAAADFKDFVHQPGVVVLEEE